VAKAKHNASFEKNCSEVLRLVEIHEELTGTARGRRHGVEILHKSAIVMLCATWEALVEDLVEAALAAMIAKAVDYSVFPQSVLDRVASNLQGPKAWALAGAGWKTALQNNLKEVLAKTTGTLNTPKTEQVDALFAKTVGVPRLSDSWHWKGSSSTRATKLLDELVVLRGSIAHRVQATTDVKKANVLDSANLIKRLAAASSNAIRDYINQRIGSPPWDEAPIEIA
jgi:hypothetical protein